MDELVRVYDKEFYLYMRLFDDISIVTDADAGRVNYYNLKNELIGIIYICPFMKDVYYIGKDYRGKMKKAKLEDQAWFWTEKWQAGQREAEQNIGDGNVSKEMNKDETMEHLDSLMSDSNKQRKKMMDCLGGELLF